MENEHYLISAEKGILIMYGPKDDYERSKLVGVFYDSTVAGLVATALNAAPPAPFVSVAPPIEEPVVAPPPSEEVITEETP